MTISPFLSKRCFVLYFACHSIFDLVSKVAIVFQPLDKRAGVTKWCGCALVDAQRGSFCEIPAFCSLVSVIQETKWERERNTVCDQSKP